MTSSQDFVTGYPRKVVYAFFVGWNSITDGLRPWHTQDFEARPVGRNFLQLLISASKIPPKRPESLGAVMAGYSFRYSTSPECL